MATSFTTAHKKKLKLTAAAEARIKTIYLNSSAEIKKELDSIIGLNTSDRVKQIYLKELLKKIDVIIDKNSAKVYTEIVNDGLYGGKIAIDAGNETMAKVGLELKGAFSYIPKQQIETIISGSLYGNNWSLSKAIWKANKKVKTDVENVVARGLTENKSIKAIAEDLVQYVRPSARKPWDWSKVYPGTSQKVEYNAQRLARTMIQHAFQTSMVQQMEYNPFCNGIVWHSAAIHGRTCQVCLERDEQVFAIKDLPLDHPNGLCYFEPALDDMIDISNRLARWANGANDFEINNYIEHAF